VKTSSTLLLLLVAFQSQATVPVSYYEEYKDEPYMISYVWGATSGLMIAAEINEDKGGTPFIACQTTW
jgi:uncharacterized integral membrane protein